MIEQSTNLLIIEDEPITRAQLSAHFEKEGYTVYTKEDADGVADFVKEKDIDLLLLDINLPGKDGLTLTRELRATSEVGIILVTGKDEQIDRIVGLESGADDYVTKPFDLRELLSRVKNLNWRVKAQEKQKEKEIQDHMWKSISRIEQQRDEADDTNKFLRKLINKYHLENDAFTGKGNIND